MSYKTPKWIYNWFLIGWFIVISSYIIIVSASICRGAITIQDYFLQQGDSFAAFFTALSIAVILYQIRSQENMIEQQLEEASKERNTSIKLNYYKIELSQLDKQISFYSKILGKLNQCWNIRPNDEEIPLPSDFKTKMDEEKIPYEYEYLAKEELKEALRTYYTTYRTANISPRTTALENFKELMNEIKENAKNDIISLQLEYSQILKHIGELQFN